MAKQNVDYGYDIQVLYLEMMLADAETFIRCQSIFDHTLFDRKLQNTAKFINDYVVNHTILPTYDIVNSATKQSFKHPGDLHEEHFDWLLIEFETFIRHKGLERAILQADDMLQNGEYGPVEELIKKAVQVGLTKNLGTDYFSDPKSRLLKIKDSNGQMSTGWDNLDKILYGGFNNKELEIFCGGSGAGKSLFLANLSVNYALSGKTVVYLTLELSEELVAMRIDSMVTGIATKTVFKNIEDVDMKVRLIGKKSGSLQIKYLPSGKTCNDIRSYLKEYEVKIGKKVDVLVIDYLDLLMPISKKISAENLFIKDKYVSEELRNLAAEKNCVLISASQLNRQSSNEVEFDHSHISGGLSKIQTADNVFGIYTNNAMRERGKYQLQLMKTRNSSGVGQKIELDFDIDTLRITASSDDSSYTPPASTILNNLQRTSSIENNSPTTPVKKIIPQVEGTKLRALLNTVGNMED